MIVKVDLTRPQAEKLFWALKDLNDPDAVGPLARGLGALTEALDEVLSRDADE